MYSIIRGCEEFGREKSSSTSIFGVTRVRTNLNRDDDGRVARYINIIIVASPSPSSCIIGGKLHVMCIMVTRVRTTCALRWMDDVCNT
jgi:hypothetical protein